MDLSLYIHIPFCGSRCPYCDFAFEVRKTSLASRYADAVVRELDLRVLDAARFSTIFFGGGTPTEVPARALNRILENTQRNWSILPKAEITAEANPDDAARFADVRALGANRLSIGAQSLDDTTLKALGRRHTAGQVREAFKAARSAGFDNVNLDLLFGAPGQELRSWLDTLDRAVALQPEHLSVYGLTIEPGTAFHRRRARGTLQLPDEDLQAEMYDATLDRLAAAGFVQYEISNFATPGAESQHNLAYWRRRPYLGVGLSAHSCLDGRRSWNTDDLQAYLAQVESGGTAVDGTESLTEENTVAEEILLGLRMPQGIPEDLVSTSSASQRLGRLADDHLVDRTDGRVRLTRKGILVADLVCAELVCDV